MLNTNLVHNILNFIGLLVGVLLTADWAGLGLSPADAAKAAAWVLLLSNLIKVTINFTRDGATGLLKPQPPVSQSPAEASAVAVAPK